MKKERFVTTLKPETIVNLKIIAAKNGTPVNVVLEEMINEYFEKGSLFKK